MIPLSQGLFIADWMILIVLKLQKMMECLEEIVKYQGMAYNPKWVISNKWTNKNNKSKRRILVMKLFLVDLEV